LLQNSRINLLLCFSFFTNHFMNQTFTKDERLSSNLLIKKLFDKGKKWYFFPFRITVFKCRIPSKYPVQLLISVPRSLFRNAVDRNRIKRLIREAYRKNKYLLYESLEESHVQMLICFQYTTKEILSYQIIQEKIIVLLQRFKEENAEITE
jgi:ribonuclease P protein component